ncbi:hypothetical protein ACJ41O_013716 [Fusarium nematophilum]
MTNPESPSNCPFCGFKPEQGEYELLLHIENHHPDGQSPFAVAEDPVPCPNDSCGEFVSPDELAFHLELHEMEAQDATPEPPEPPLPPRPDAKKPASRSPSSSRDGSSSRRHRGDKKVSTIQAWMDLLSGNRSSSSSRSGRGQSGSRTRHKYKRSATSEAAGVSKSTHSQPTQEGERVRQFTRLGKSELGRFAHEKKMPSWLVDLLGNEGQVLNDGIMPVLRQLLEQSPSTQVAYLCHPQVQHVSKLRREGGFCGYRNIQMLVSHIIGAKTTGSQQFGDTFPSIFQLQDLIENAWDMGINSQGRVETGVQAFKDKERGRSKTLLLQAIESYFQGGINDVEDRIHLTDLPPIYLQHPGTLPFPSPLSCPQLTIIAGHSLTIVGIEKQMDGEVNLLVFDPSFRDSTKIQSLVGKAFRYKLSSIDESLQPYRRGSHYLRKYTAFEVL